MTSTYVEMFLSVLGVNKARKSRRYSSDLLQLCSTQQVEIPLPIPINIQKDWNHAPFRKSLKSLSPLYQFLNFKVLHRRLKYKSTFKLSTEVCNLILKCVTLWIIHKIPHTHKIFNLYSVGPVLGNNLILMAVTGQCACASRCLNRDSTLQDALPQDVLSSNTPAVSQFVH